MALEELDNDINTILNGSNPKLLINVLNTKEEEEIISITFGETGYTSKNNPNIIYYYYLVLQKIILSKLSNEFDLLFDLFQRKLTPDKLTNYINIADEEGNTALLYAAYRGNIHIIEILINNGAIVNVLSKQKLNVIHMAAQGDNPNIIIYFKEKYGFSVYTPDGNGNTPLHWACYSCSESTVNFLLCLMDTINFQDNKGQTPLHIAIFTERIKIIKKLLKKGADLTIKDKSGRTPIELAKSLTSASSKVTYLLRHHKKIKGYFYEENEFSRKKTSSIINIYSFLASIIVLGLIVFFLQLSYLHYVFKALFIFIALILLINFIYITNANPGFIKRKNLNETWLTLVEEKVNIKGMCPYCMVKKLKFSKHCFECGYCVKEFDHHCKLLANCIGSENRTYYILFLINFLIYTGFTYYVAMCVFLIKEATINNKGFIIPFYFIYRKTFKDTIAVLVMTFAILFFGFGGFLLFSQLRQMVIMKKIKSI